MSKTKPQGKKGIKEPNLNLNLKSRTIKKGEKLAKRQPKIREALNKVKESLEAGNRAEIFPEVGRVKNPESPGAGNRATKFPKVGRAKWPEKCKDGNRATKFPRVGRVKQIYVKKKDRIDESQRNIATMFQQQGRRIIERARQEADGGGEETPERAKDPTHSFISKESKSAGTRH